MTLGEAECCTRASHSIGRSHRSLQRQIPPMPAQTHLFLCLQDNFGVLIHDPATGATASIDAPEALRSSTPSTPPAGS